jgi:hypothetical protein
MSSENSDEPTPYVVKLRGLPYEVTKAQIIAFLEDVDINGKKESKIGFWCQFRIL